MTLPEIVLDLWHEQQMEDFGRDLVEWLEFKRDDEVFSVDELIDHAKREYGDGSR